MKEQRYRSSIKKKITISFTSFIFTFSFLLFLPQMPVSAEEATVASLEEPVAYTLPYPGLLPDHPLYFLKLVRDNMTAFFIGKPLEKAEFALEQADKHVAASRLTLLEKGKEHDAITLFEQSQEYLIEAITQTEAAEKQGINITEFSEQLTLASQKHKEVLLTLENDTGTSEELTEQKKQADKLINDVLALHH